MAHLHYEEEQRFSNIRWIWVILLMVLLLPSILISADESTSQKDIMWILLVSLITALPVTAILFYAKLLIQVDGKELRYKFFPAVLKWRSIPKDAIESYEVTAMKNIVEKLQFGYRRNLLNKITFMNITGKKLARVRLKDGRELKIGTANPESFERALRKLTSPDNY